MVVGTSSNCGKSTVVAGLCRYLARNGYRVAPFKGQNMSLNSYVTRSGGEISRAQASQAMAAMTEPHTDMNPVLLKPSNDSASQVIVKGSPQSEMGAREFQAHKSNLVSVVDSALARLGEDFDFVVLEGAGSPAEINLMDNDLVNLGLAERFGIPALIVGDIDRGGVFAHLFGTHQILPRGRQELIFGYILNKFRGDSTLLDPAIDQLANATAMGCLGIVHHENLLNIDQEDSMTLDGLVSRSQPDKLSSVLDVAVVALEHISNFTDLEPLVYEENVSLRLVSSPQQLGTPDLVVIPGTKATVCDLEVLYKLELDQAIWNAYRNGSVILGICGGYQMLGTKLVDYVESGRGEVFGMGMLDCETIFESRKITRQVVAQAGPWALGAPTLTGYEVHHGVTRPGEATMCFASLDVPTGGVHWVDEMAHQQPREGSVSLNFSVFGTSIHGLFENDDFRRAFLFHVANKREKPFTPSQFCFSHLRESYYDRLADILEASVEIEAIIEISAKYPLGRSSILK